MFLLKLLGRAALTLALLGATAVVIAAGGCGSYIPHEPDPEPIRHIVESVKGGTAVYSEYESAGRQPDAGLESAQVLIIDKVGMLSHLYRYGWAALIGGGFINMPHSVIEASVYGLPVVMGPQYHKNLQFVELMPSGAAVPVKDEADIAAWFGKLHDDPEYLSRVSRAAYDYCKRNCGATDTIMNILF